MAQSTFDPSQHLSTIKGQEYLEVKWRLAWLRSEHPDAIISTELSSHAGDRAIFSAKVTLPDGGSATGWGSETAGSFGNYIEKAETKAIGRALAALGYGTQFCLDFDDGPETGVLADAPVQLRQNGQGTTRAPQSQNRDSRNPYDGMSEPQKKKILAMARNVGVPSSELNDVALSITGTPFLNLGKQQASAVIDHLARLESESSARKAS